MKQVTFGFLFSAVLFSLVLVGCNSNQQPANPTNELKAADATAGTDDQLLQERLRRFDSLDFQFYSNQQWDSLAISHDENIKVYYPDGTTSTGLFPQHIDLIKGQFVFAPDTKIISHPVKFFEDQLLFYVGNTRSMINYH